MALTPDQVASEISNTMSYARAEANSALSASNAMVLNAVSILTGYAPDYPSETITVEPSGYSLGSGFDATEKPPSFPTIRTPNAVTMGALGDIDTLDDTFTAEEPTLNLPAFDYSIPTKLNPFTQTAPEIDSSVDIPDVPAFTYPGLPELLALNTDIELDDLVIPPLSITNPSYNNILSDDFYSAFATGRTELPNYDQYGMELVNRFYPNVQAAVQTLVGRASGILDGTQTALTDNHDQRYYDLLRARIATERDKAVQAVDDASVAAGWDLPGLVRAAGQKRIQQDSAAGLNNAALEVYVKRADRELQHLQFIMQVIPTLQSSAVSLFGQAWGMQMQAFQGALSFADTAMRFATAVYQLKQRDYELAQGLVERQIRIFEALLKAELAKADVTQKKLEVERLKAEINQQQVSLYTAQLSGEETKARVYASQIDALRQTIEARKLPLDVFLGNVQAFTALAETKKAEYALVEAQISGDKAKTEGELAKLQVYKTKADVFGTTITAKAKKIEGQVQRNNQILEEFKARVRAEVDLTQIDAAIAAHSLDAYKAMSAVYIAETQAELEQAKFAFQKSLEDARLELDQTKLSFERQFRALEIEMNRVDATARITLAGAEVQARTGQAAISVMNTMTQLSASASA